MEPEPVTEDSPLAGKLLAEVAALVRDLDPGELTLRASGEAELLVRLTVRHTAAFSIATAEGKGPLPDGVERFSSRAGLQAKLDRLLERAQQEGGGLIDQWADEAAGEYRAVLPAGRCLARRPAAGVEEVCATCQGRKRLRCPSCNGQKQVTCQPCQGQGRTRCQNCDGGWKTCFSCHGQGYIEKTELELNYVDRQNTMNQQRQLTRQVPCQNCTNGRQPCGSCDHGLVTCLGCNGMRQVNCPECKAQGTIECGACAATGVVHHTGWTHCEVRRSTWVEVESANPEDQQTLRERTPFDQIGRLATNSGGIWANRGVLLDQRHRDGSELTVWYSASVRLEYIEATAGGERVTIRAYGPQREIYNYHNVIGRLLSPDLMEIEKALPNHSVFSARLGSSLAPLVKRFLASEAHGKIAQAPATLAPLIAAGMLGPEHIQRAQAVMSKVAPRLYGPLVLPSALWGTVGLTALFWVVRTHFPQWSPNEKFYSLLGLTAIAWAAVEYRAQSELKAILSPPTYERLKAIFSKARNPYRLLPAAGFFFSWYITFLIFQLILHFRYGRPLNFFPPLN